MSHSLQLCSELVSCRLGVADSQLALRLTDDGRSRLAGAYLHIASVFALWRVPWAVPPTTAEEVTCYYHLQTLVSHRRAIAWRACGARRVLGHGGRGLGGEHRGVFGLSDHLIVSYTLLLLRMPSCDASLVHQLILLRCILQRLL